MGLGCTAVNTDDDWKNSITVPDDYYDMADRLDSRHIFGDF